MENTNNMDSIEKNMDNVEQEGQTILQRPTRRHRRRPEDDKYFKIRNILNIIFMIGAVVGVIVFCFKDQTMGTIVILTAMAFKIAECCFRLIRQ